MINRVLIRIKVVQMLYSYLLTRNIFTLPQIPESTSRDKMFAYQMYCQLMLSLLKLCGIRNKGEQLSLPISKYLSENRVIKALAADSGVKDMLFKYLESNNRYNVVLADLYDELTASAAYRSYSHTRKLDFVTDQKILTTVISTVMRPNKSLLNAARSESEFTAVGYEMAFSMLESTIDSLSNSRTMYIDARHNLQRSLDKANDLYHMLLLLPVEITAMQDLRLDNARHKHLATTADLNPDTRFIENRLVKALAENSDLKSFVEKNPGSWVNDQDLIKRLLDLVTSSTYYQEYMDSSHTSCADDCDLWYKLMKNVILPSDDLAEVLESKSVYWNDDIDIIGTFVTKTIRKSAVTPGTVTVLPKYKDQEDADFGAQLFGFVVDNYETYRGYVDKFVNSSNWDPERLAFMDVVILVTAIAEMIHYPSIPLAVTINEYIEIANAYSTPRSGQFVNGVLFAVSNHLRQEGIIAKN